MESVLIYLSMCTSRRSNSVVQDGRGEGMEGGSPSVSVPFYPATRAEDSSKYHEAFFYSDNPKFSQVDTNGDGCLSEPEANAYNISSDMLSEISGGGDCISEGRNSQTPAT